MTNSSSVGSRRSAVGSQQTAVGSRHFFGFLLTAYCLLPTLAIAFLFAFIPLVRAESTPSRGLWITVYQEPPVLSSSEEITKLIDFARQHSIKTLYIQLYRSNKSQYPSKIADDSAYWKNFNKIGSDPITLLIAQAHQAGLEVFAWMNLLSLSANEEAAILKRYGPEVLTRNVNPKQKLQDFKIDNQYFLDPGDLRVRRHLSQIAGELVSRYPTLDGVQFDYIRYPDKEPHYGYTKMNMRRFKKAAGLQTIEDDGKAWKDWKRRQVNELVHLLSWKVRKINPRLKVAASVLAPYSRAYHEAFQEWNLWVEKKWVDFVIVMSYSPDSNQVRHLIHDAQKRVTNRQNVSIGIWAEERSKVKELAVFDRQARICEEASKGACIFLEYGTFTKNPSMTAALTVPRGDH